MDTVDMNTNGCYIEHETLIVDEYGEEVTCTGWNPLLTLAGEFNKLANDHGRASIPDIDLPSVPVDATAFPQCP